VTDEPSIGPDLVTWGRAIRLETVGRRTGRPATAFVSFHEEADGSLLVAAASPSAGWAQNLAAEPSATVTLLDRRFPVVAERLEGADFATAIRELIVKGGTPAERLGHGPAFRLRRVLRDA
jgi:deazaflavin-dependent oxidoreductase (nitroreductase family)